LNGLGIEMLVDRSWLEASATLRLIAALDKADIDFRFVGGAVRDALLGRPVADVDLATPARPEKIMHALQSAGLKAIPTGIDHGTVTARVQDRSFEITTLRRDVETDGRHAVVAFTDDWREDAARRDFTMNALYADREGRITDYFGGVADARSGHVRFIGDPAARIAEDALRILRFFRFHAHYGKGPLGAPGLAACANHAGMLDGLSGERVRDEVFKLLSAVDPAPVWRAMIDAGVMDHVIPAAVHVDALAKMIALEHGMGLSPHPIRRLAALIGKPAAVLKSRLRLSNTDADHLSSFTNFADRISLIAQGAFARALYGANPLWVRDAAMLSQAENETLADLQRFIGGWSEPRFPLSGADLQAEGIAPGPEMGRLLAELERRWLDADFALDRVACLAELRKVLAARGAG
jgi:poly(A) polymerase